jgi:2-keto-4-pentenoate hydratase
VSIGLHKGSRSCSACPIPDWRFEAADTVAAYAVHDALVIGTPVAGSEIEDCAERPRRFEVVLFRDGVQQARGVVANVLDSPLLAFAHLEEVLSTSRAFRPFRSARSSRPGR